MTRAYYVGFLGVVVSSPYAMPIASEAEERIRVCVAVESGLVMGSGSRLPTLDQSVHRGFCPEEGPS